jgi:glutamyl/glutaminyl-tRNA synthetase
VEKVRFAPSPTGSLRLGDALGAVAGRRFGDRLVLRIDDADPERDVAGGEEAVLRDLEWLGIEWDEGPIRQSERRDLHRAAAKRLGRAVTDDLAGVVDDIELGITHVLCGNDQRPNEELQRELAEALGARPPEYVHHGLVAGPTVESLRDAGIPAEAVRRYLEELGLPRDDVSLDLRRLRRLAVEAIAALPDEELAGRVAAPPAFAPALRGARDLSEAREYALALAEPQPVRLPAEAIPTLARFAELRGGAHNGVGRDAAKAIVRELNAVGGDLKALRLALTGRERGPELWAIVAALPRDETLRRVDAAL